MGPCVYICMHAKSLQSCPTMCESMDCTPPGSSVHGILQARILEWVAMPSSRGTSQPRDRTQNSYMSPELASRFFNPSATWEAYNTHLIWIGTVSWSTEANFPKRYGKKEGEVRNMSGLLLPPIFMIVFELCFYLIRTQSSSPMPPSPPSIPRLLPPAPSLTFSQFSCQKLWESHLHLTQCV